MYKSPFIKFCKFQIAILICFFHLNGYAQFTLSGSATSDGDSCFTLTTAAGGLVGSLWSTNKVSLDKSFEIYADIYLGDRDANGADGMTFSLQPISNTVGSSGGGLGMEGISPSFFVEFDTWQNGNYNDPVYDHLAIMSNGVIDHMAATSLVAPVSINPAFANAEDSTFHLMQIKWDAPSKTFSVSVDCDPKLTYTGDIVADIFNSDPNVFWGLTGSTGGAWNEQRFCFRYISFDDIVEKEICKGDSVSISTIPGSWFNWRPYAGLNNPSVQSPLASPDSTTLYHVKYIDVCGKSRFDTVLIKVRRPYFETDSLSICQGDSALIGNEYQLEEGIYYFDTTRTFDFCDSIIHRKYLDIRPLPPTLGNDTSICPNEPLLLWVWDSTYTFKWNTGATSINILIDQPGSYWVDMTKNNCTTRSYFTVGETAICEANIQPANLFTPNDDGQNDFFPAFVDGIEEFNIKIFNRWGIMVFESDDLSMPWDGTENGKPLSEGVYFYQMTYLSQYEKGAPKLLEGSITLLR